MCRVCMCRVCMGRVCYVPSLLWAEFVMCRVDPTPLVVSALAFSARGHGFDPRGRRRKISVSEHAFLSVICRDDTK